MHVCRMRFLFCIPSIPIGLGILGLEVAQGRCSATNRTHTKAGRWWFNLGSDEVDANCEKRLGMSQLFQQPQGIKSIQINVAICVCAMHHQKPARDYCIRTSAG